MYERSTRRVHTSPPTSPVRTSPAGSLLGFPTLGVSRLVLAEDASQGGSGRRMPRLRDSVGERATSSISPLQPDDDAEGLAKGPGPMPKRKRSKNDSQSNQERHSPRRRPPAWVGASQGCEEDADGDGDADELQMLREQQEMQSLEIGMMLEFQERRDEEEMARSQEQLRLIRCLLTPTRQHACPSARPPADVMRLPADLKSITPPHPDLKSCSLASPINQLIPTEIMCCNYLFGWADHDVPQRRAGDGF